MIKAIVFDLGGVIFSSDGGSYETREQLAKDLNVNSKKLHDFWFDRKEDMITGKMSEDYYLKTMIQYLGIKITLEELKKIIRSYNVVDEGMLNLIEKLKSKYKILALTNDVKEWTDYRIENFNLAEYFESIISSSHIGLAKPDIKIYKYLINQLGLKPDEIVFVDNRMENVSPASDLGIKAFHFIMKMEFEKWLLNEKIF